jgi:hypothetical protein
MSALAVIFPPTDKPPLALMSPSTVTVLVGSKFPNPNFDSEMASIPPPPLPEPINQVSKLPSPNVIILTLFNLANC